MARNNPAKERLKGWSNIARYMGQTTATVQRWAKSGMPLSREGRSVVASGEALRTWLARESGHQSAQIITNETDLGAVLKHGLKDLRANRKADPAKRHAERRRRVRLEPPAPKPQIPSYSPVLPLSQVESRITGLEKRLQQLQEIMKSIGAEFEAGMIRFGGLDPKPQLRFERSQPAATDQTLKLPKCMCHRRSQFLPLIYLNRGVRVQIPCGLSMDI
jgi:hypothetical protein